MGTYLFLYLGGDGQLSVFLLGEGGHVFVFVFDEKGLPPILFLWSGWPPIYCSIWEGMATYQFFSLGGLVIYLFSIGFFVWEGIAKLFIFSIWNSWPPI